jgi:hypothetical protein
VEAAPDPDPIDEQGGRTSGGGKAALDELVVLDEIGTDVSFAGSLSPATLCLRAGAAGDTCPAHISPYYFVYSRVNLTPSAASFRLTPLVLGRRWISTPFSFLITVAPAPSTIVPSADTAE